MKLLENGTNKTGAGEPFIFIGGLATIYCWGNFAGATVKLRVSPDSNIWFDLDGFTFTQAPRPKNLHIAECRMRGEIMGGTDDTLIQMVVKEFVK